MSLPYWMVDAFTGKLFAGNPAAVVLCTEMPADGAMQSIAAENNLSETAFACPDRADASGRTWHLRWFTPTVEVDLCGHATLATAFVLANQGHTGPFRFQTRSGTLGAALDGPGITLDFPARTFAHVEAPEGLEAALGARPVETLRSADLIAVLATAAEVRDLRPNIGLIRDLPGGAVIVTAHGDPQDEGADVTSRYFAPAYGIDEDPVTGSLHTQVVPYWAQRLGRNTLLCRQASRRGGEMTCVFGDNRVAMTGRAVLYARGEIFI